MKGLRVEVLPLFPAIGPTRGGSGRIPGKTAIGVVELDDRIDVLVVQLAEGVLQVDDVGAGGGIVGVAIFEVGPVDVRRVEWIVAEGRTASFKRGLGGDVVAPGGEVVGRFRLNYGWRGPNASSVDVRETPPIGGVAAGQEVAAVVADNLGRFAGESAIERDVYGLGCRAGQQECGGRKGRQEFGETKKAHDRAANALLGEPAAAPDILSLMFRRTLKQRSLG